MRDIDEQRLKAICISTREIADDTRILVVVVCFIAILVAIKLFLF